jgi:arsenate reductase
MAQGFLQAFDKRLQIFSAGTEPAARINPTAVKVMKEAGIDISKNKPRNVDQYLNEAWDYVITVCDNANESCPVFPGKVRNRIHMGFEDPSNFKGTDTQIINEFRRIRDQIRSSFYKFYSDLLV